MSASLRFSCGRSAQRDRDFLPNYFEGRMSLEGNMGLSPMCCAMWKLGKLIE